MSVEMHHSGVSRERLCLTRAESRVLPYLPTHLSIEAIAERLGRSRSTVKTHLAHIYEKLGATTRAEAVNRARELGLLAPERNPTAVATKETLTASRR
jgi:LuxR family maltose regulon positive regulatory protein